MKDIFENILYIYLQNISNFITFLGITHIYVI